MRINPGFIACIFSKMSLRKSPATASPGVREKPSTWSVAAPCTWKTKRASSQLVVAVRVWEYGAQRLECSIGGPLLGAVAARPSPQTSEKLTKMN